LVNADVLGPSATFFSSGFFCIKFLVEASFTYSGFLLTGFFGYSFFSSTFFTSGFFPYSFFYSTFFGTTGVFLAVTTGVLAAFGLFTLGGISSFFAFGDVTLFSFGATFPVALNVLGMITFSQNEKSGIALFLFSTASYPYPLLPQLVSKYLLSHCMNYKLSWYLALTSFST
jgi:hypothetical protein